MALATAKITELIDKIIEALNTADIEDIVGVYWGDQESYSAYPVICVGAPPLLNEEFPVMAGETVRDEIYNIPILLYVEYDDTLPNKKLLYNLTGAIRTTLRSNYLSNYIWEVKVQISRYVFATKGNVNLRVSETTIQYKKRIS